jgi:hypothetical protein
MIGLPAGTHRLGALAPARARPPAVPPDDAEYVDPRYLARAARVEAALTPVLHAITESVGGWLWGLADRRKSVAAIGRKLAGQLRDSPDLTLAEALAQLPDAVRYTVGLPEDGYAAGAHHVIGALDRRYRAVRLVNSWGAADRYPGIVGWWTERRTGQLFEVQLHTAASYAVRTGEHGLTYRLILLTPDPGPLLARLRAVLAEVPVPEGAARVGV